MNNVDGQVSLFGPDSWRGRMCPEVLVRGRPKGRIFASSSKKFAKLVAIPFMSLDLTPGHGNLLGESYWEIRSPWRSGSWTLNTGVSPREGRVCSLSRILEDSPPHKYYLSRKACLGILRRSKERGKPLPPQLEAALKAQAGLTIYLKPVKDPPLAFHMNQRDEAIDLGETAGALMATSNMQMQTFVTAFASNQRDEVRDLHDVAGALSAQPGMKQQTFVADCLTPWDTQQARIFTPDSTAPTLAGADGGGGRNPGGLVFAAGFCAGAGPSAGGIGYQEEVAPTLKASASGNMMPSVLCLNDQGGSMMECSKDISGTLRAQEHGHQPLVFENHGIAARYTGPHDIVPTITARSGTGGNSLPLVEQEDPVFCLTGNIIDRQPQNGGNGIGVQEDLAYTLTATDHHAVFARQRCDNFQEGAIASTESVRQHKDATDLVYQETVGVPTTGDSESHSVQDVSQVDLTAETPLLIRRLTPRECERLQGFPDDWTALPGAADGPRYRSLGNSVAIQCVEYLMHGMALVLRSGTAGEPV